MGRCAEPLPADRHHQKGVASHKSDEALETRQAAPCALHTIVRTGILYGVVRQGLILSCVVQDLENQLQNPHQAENQGSEDQRAELVGEGPAEAFEEGEVGVAEMRKVPVGCSGGDDELTNCDGHLAIPK